MKFTDFSHAVHANFERMSKGELFVTDTEDLWTSYLLAFPPGTDPIFRVRTEHDCNCCKQYIRRVGNVVSIDESGKVHTVWDNLNLGEPYGSVARRLSDLVRQAPIKTVFRSKEKKYGQDHNFDTQTNARWDHFCADIGPKHYSPNAATLRGEQEATFGVFKRGLTEFNLSDLNTIIDLIDENGLYKGADFRASIVKFRDLKKKWDGTDLYIWANLQSPVAKFRNTAIGQLFVDLASGTEIDHAVRKYESMVAPQNYKRPTSVITTKMVDEAVATLKSLGLEGAVNRRFAVPGDVSVRNALFVDNAVRGKMRDGISNLLADSVKQKDVDPKKATAISIKDFLATVLPSATAIDLFLENKHVNNFVSLTGGDGPERLFKWDNNFAWSYDGEVTDSIKQRVKSAGGNISALLRISLGWSNYDDLDLYCQTPRRGMIYYGNRLGILDVDMNCAGRRDSRTPVENLAFNQVDNGVYKVHPRNYMTCESSDKGYTLEVEMNGVVHQFSNRTSPRGSSTGPGIEITIKDNKIVSIKPDEGLTGGSYSVDKWGIKTEMLTPVTMLMNSPNHWDGQEIGSKHWFFMLKDCKNPLPVRGIYNEFLRPEFEKHRKVFEVLGSKTKCPSTDDQISGVGFTSARGDTVTVVVNGKRAYNITF